MSGSGLERTVEQAPQGSPWGGNPAEHSQLSAPLFIPSPFSLTISESDETENREGTGGGKSDMS